jgi:hypothetical protein
MIKKPSIVITSLGRTGTKFFSTLFGEIIPDSASLHEPDVFNFVQYGTTGERIRQIFKQIREAGVSNLIIRRAFGKWSLIELSDARVRGELGYAEAVQQVLSQRREFIHSQEGSLYIEANIGYYGLIDVLRNVYEHCRVVYIIRDGRDWVRSHMDWGEMYGKGRIRSLLAHTWPTACETEDPYKSKWESMSRFERLCWAWARLNEYALRTIQENRNARLFRFENIFRSEDSYQHLADLVEYATTFPHAGRIATSPLDGWLEQQIHRSFARFPLWEEWTKEERRQFEVLCGPLMRALDYS